MLLSIDTDNLNLIADHAGSDNALAISLVCKTMRVACRFTSFKTTFAYAVGGSVNLVNWALDIGADRAGIEEAAVVHAGISVLARLIERGFAFTTLCEHAAALGDVDRLAWARARGCAWDWRVHANAVRGGHLDVIRWAFAHDCPYPAMESRIWNPGMLDMAVEGGHVHILDWLHHNYQPFPIQGDADWTATAAALGHLDVLKWLRAHGCEWDSSKACSYAAEHAHIHILEWAHSNGCDVDDPVVCEYAAGAGHLHVLQWLRAHDFPWNAGTCRWAEANGHLDVLVWARANGCPE